mgnify:CR=1 FL=1
MEQLLYDLYEMNHLLELFLKEPNNPLYKNTIKRIRRLQRDTLLLTNEVEHILNPDKPRWKVEQINGG